MQISVKPWCSNLFAVSLHASSQIINRRLSQSVPNWPPVRWECPIRQQWAVTLRDISVLRAGLVKWKQYMGLASYL